MTDITSDLLTSFIVAIVITIPIMVILILGGGITYLVKELTFPAYQIAFGLWVILTMIVFMYLRAFEPKMYEA